MSKHKEQSSEANHTDAMYAVEEALERDCRQLDMAAMIYRRHNLVKEASDLQQSIVEVRKSPGNRTEVRDRST
jgi:hypothetical protein